MRIMLLIFVAVLASLALPAQAGKLNDLDRQVVATCMVLEAGCDGVEGMQAVLNVILTRADGYLDQLVPQTIKHGAFSAMSKVWHEPTPDYSPLITRARNQGEVYDHALQLITIMEKGLLWDNTYGATHYHASYIRPYWVSDMGYLTTIGGHHFYDENAPYQASL